VNADRAGADEKLMHIRVEQASMSAPSFRMNIGALGFGEVHRTHVRATADSTRR